MILVTGSSGHIGNVLVRQLISQGEKVAILTKSGQKPECLEDFNLIVFKGNLTDVNAIDTAVKNCDVVFHLAGIISISSFESKELYETNVLGTQYIIDACLKYNISRLIYTSTVHALPESQEGNIVESKEFDLERIEGAYARTKAEATIRILSATQKGLNAVVCYPSAVIGPYDFRGSEAGKMIRDYATNKIPAYIHGAYNFVDVRDVVNGLLLAQSKAKSGDSYILAGERMTLKQFFIILASLEPKMRMPKICIPVFLALSFAWILERVCLLISVKPFFTVYGIKVLQSNSNISSIKAIQELGYQARPIKESIADSLKWYKSNGLL